MKRYGGLSDIVAYALTAASLLQFTEVSPHHHRRGSRWAVKSSRYDGTEMRRLAAERGIGATKHVPEEIRATWRTSPR